MAIEFKEGNLYVTRCGVILEHQSGEDFDGPIYFLKVKAGEPGQAGDNGVGSTIMISIGNTRRYNANGQISLHGGIPRDGYRSMEIVRVIEP